MTTDITYYVTPDEIAGLVVGAGYAGAREGLVVIDGPLVEPVTLTTAQALQLNEAILNATTDINTTHVQALESQMAGAVARFRNEASLPPAAAPVRGGRLYKVEITSYPDGALRRVDEEFDYFGEESWDIDPAWRPEGWAAYSEEQWGKVRGFWWPSTKTLYRSRSGATDRARLIESFGATAVVIESEPIVWLTPEVKRTRTIAKLRAQIAELERAS